MLISLTLKNVLSYAQETTFSMVAGKITKQHMNHVTKIDNLPILRGAIIYGPNAAGKSNLLKAMGILWAMLNIDDCRFAARNRYMLAPISSSARVMSWKLVYARNGRVFQYHVETDGAVVLSEKLDLVSDDGIVPLFNRNRMRVRFGGWLEGSEWLRGRSFRSTGFFLAKIVQDGIFERFAEIEHGELLADAAYGATNFEVLHSEASPRVSGLASMLEMDEFKSFLKNLLKVADLGIEDVVWRPCVARESQGLFETIARAHEIKENEAHFIESSGAMWALTMKNGRPVAYELRFMHHGVLMRMGDESEGTIRLFRLSLFLYSLRTSDKTWMIDEIDNHLHPYMTRFVLQSFMDMPETRAQVIATAHDTSLMTQDIWRSDEVWFAEKRPDGSSDLYSLYQYTPRFDKNLEKGYRQGLYGAIPHIGGEMLHG